MSRPTTIDVDQLAALLATAIRLGVRDLPGTLRREGVAGGPELLVLRAMVGSGRGRQGQSSTDGAAMVEGDGMLAFSFVDAGRQLSVSESTVKRMVASGELHAINVAGARRIPQVELEAFVAKQMAPEPATSRTPDEETP